MPRGGARQGAGRPKGSGKFGEPTVSVRIPLSRISDFQKWLVSGSVQTAPAPTNPNAGRQVLEILTNGEGGEK